VKKNTICRSINHSGVFHLGLNHTSSIRWPEVRCGFFIVLDIGLHAIWRVTMPEGAPAGRSGKRSLEEPLMSLVKMGTALGGVIKNNVPKVWTGYLVATRTRH
jgi:hypothetical protein